MSKVVAIEAGHGINTAGKRTPDGEREWTFSTVVVESAIKELGKYKVKIVRLDDPTGKRDVPLRERTDKANKAKSDILVSVHHNAFEGKWGNHTGTVTFHYPNSTRGRKLAKKIHPYVVKAYQLRDRGIKSANFHMLRESNMPAILIEGGFMDSRIDIKKLRDKSVLKQAGRNIAQGIVEHLGLKKKAPQAPNKPSTPSGKLHKVQLGAFKNKENAKNLEKRAKKEGFDTFVVREGSLYKVQIGAYANAENAKKQAQKANDKGFDVYITNGVKTPAKPHKQLQKGDKVKIKSSAKRYATGETIPGWVKKRTHTVEQVTATKVLLKEIYSWVRKGDIK